MPDCVLAIDTSTPEGQVAVWRNGTAVFQEGFRSHRSHNARLFGPLGRALDLCGGDLRCLVAGTGPGSYTGVRIAIAAVQGVAWSRGVPVIGLPSVLAPGAPGVPAVFTMCGDARRGQFFAAGVSAGRLTAPEIPLMDAAALAGLRQQQEGGLWYTFDEKSPAGLEGVILVRPSAVRLAEIAAGFSGRELADLSRTLLEPVYLSAPFITQAKKK